MKNIILSIFLTAVLLCVAPSKLVACTGILLQSQDSKIATGRTVEFATPLQLHLGVVPRKYNFTGKTPNGAGMFYQSKYAFTGVYCFDNQLIMDGINEKGLVVAAFFFPGYAEYTPLTSSNQNQALSPIDFPNWILSQFSTIEELQAALSTVVVVPTVIEGWGNCPPPFHYIVYNQTGESLVIEPTNGELVVYKNPLGSFTNSPTFDWHLTNMDDYIQLTPYNINPRTIRGMQFQSYGQGSGLQGLPGDFTSTSRFIRATIFSTTAVPPATATALPNQIFHILNQFDIPYGSVRQKVQGSINYDHTQLTTVKDPNCFRYYFKSYSDQTIRYLDLMQFNLNATTIKSVLIQGNQQNINITSALQ